MRKIFFSLALLVAVCVSAQVSTNPAVIQPGYTGTITITFDATKGNKGMVGATQCYAHTGYCTETADWQYNGASGVVGGSWRSTSAPKLTSLGNDKWQLVINNMYDFYKIPTGTEVTALVFVFHDGKINGQDGTKEGKTAANGDIYVWLGEENADIWDGFTPAAVVSETRPTGVSNGIYYDDNDPTKVTLCTYAAAKQNKAAKHVFVIGDMTNWKLDNAYQMKKDGNYFWITLSGLTPGKEYRLQYAIEREDGVKKQICDLYSEKVLHPDDKWEPKEVDPTLLDYPKRGADGGYVTVIQTNKPQYQWSDETLNFQRPDKNNLIIYELWVYDYAKKRTFKGVKGRLDYLQNLGVNAIELMPVSEFQGNESWGYNPTLYFAIDKTYGKADDLKELIDECHKRGIAVIVDMVFNHTTGQNPMAKLYPWTSETKTESELYKNPWFNLYPPENGGNSNGYGDEEWNHGFAPAKEMFTRVFKYWLTEYKVDGFRLDLSHGLCGTTYDAVSNLKYYYQNGVKAVSSDAYMILEHWGDGQQELINAGMLCWTGQGLCEAYYYTTEGNLDNNKNGFEDANRDGYVSYCESHDEERMQYLAKQDGHTAVKSSDAVRLGRVAENVAFNVLLNGPHMLWQYEEIGYDFSINYNERTGTKPNPANIGYFKNANRIDAFTKCAQVITLRTQLMPQVFEGNPTEVNIGTRYVTRTVRWGNDVFAMANFSPTENKTLELPSGTWYDYLNGGSRAASSYSLAPGELKVFTGTAVEAPTFSNIEKLEAIENVLSGESSKVYKILHDGQVLIVRGDRVYTITGARVQ